MDKLVHTWKYKTHNGETIGIVNRYEPMDSPKPSKSTIPLFNKDSKGNFRWGIPENIKNSRPLFGLETLQSNSIVYIVEGEKCAQALSSAFGYPCITSLGGCNGANKSNWNELSDFNKFILIPDNDDAGFKYIKDVYNCIKSINRKSEFKILYLSNLSDKEDICDWISSKINKSWNELDSLGDILSKEELKKLKFEFDSEVLKSKPIPNEWQEVIGSKGLTCMSFHSFTNLNINPPQKWLSPWLTEQSLSMIYANRGVGKTYFSLNCAYALASGKEFLKYKSENPVSVMYIDGEMQAPLMIDRLKSISNVEFIKKEPTDVEFDISDFEIDTFDDSSIPDFSIDEFDIDISEDWDFDDLFKDTDMNLDFEDIPLNIITPDLQKNRCMPDLSTLEGQAEIDEMIEQFDSKVIFVDNLSTLCRTGRENESDSWNIVQTWAIKHRSQGRSIVFVHHSNKSGGQRGSSKKEDILDNVIYLKRPDDYDESKDGAKFEVIFEKNRSLFGEDVATILANLDEHGNWEWSYTQTKEEKALEMLNSGMKQKDIAQELGVTASAISKMINRAKINQLNV